ncbi:MULTISPECIES: hypothetical protein [Pasteurellaceae]|uniref:hypothetical protein n=1 Tax=Pasteurellaceae TaxID=712 RepID=UPI003563FE50
MICGADRCSKNDDGSIVYKGNNKLPTLSDAINPSLNDKAKDLYGPTGGFQSIIGGWYSSGKALLPYNIGSFSDLLVESFAGSHDMLGGQIWGWYDKSGNTSRKDSVQQILADTTTAVAIPITAPLAMSDLISSDFMEVLFKLGEN